MTSVSGALPTDVVSIAASTRFGLVMATSDGRVLAWDGDTLRDLGRASAAHERGWIGALAACGDTIVAGGGFIAIDGTRARNLAWLDGDGWHELGAGSPEAVQSLATDQRSVVVGTEGWVTSGIRIWDF
jgi:hypothetical protein